MVDIPEEDASVVAVVKRAAINSMGSPWRLMSSPQSTNIPCAPRYVFPPHICAYTSGNNNNTFHNRVSPTSTASRSLVTTTAKPSRIPRSPVRFLLAPSSPDTPRDCYVTTTYCVGKIVSAIQVSTSTLLFTFPAPLYP